MTALLVNIEINVWNDYKIRIGELSADRYEKYKYINDYLQKILTNANELNQTKGQSPIAAFQVVDLSTKFIDQIDKEDIFAFS